MRLRALATVLLAAGLAGAALARGDEEEEAKPKGPIKKVEVPPAASPPANPGGSVTPAPGQPPGALPGYDPGGGPAPAAPAMPAPGTPPAAGAAPPAPGGPPESAAGAYYVKLPELAREAALTQDKALKAYFDRFAVAHDLVTVGLSNAVRVTPLPLLWGTDKFPAEFGVVPLDSDDQMQPAKTVPTRRVREMQCFERDALEQTAKLLALKPEAGKEPPPPERDRLAAAEKVLVGVYFFHTSAREQNRRRGKSWDAVRDDLFDRLGAVRAGRARVAGAAHDWPALKELTAKYEALYKTQPKFLEPVLAARLLEAEWLVRFDDLPRLVRARELLDDYAARFPKSADATAAAVKRALADKSKAMLREAEKVFATNKIEARNILTSVEKIDPDNGNLRSMQQEMKLGYMALFIGVRRLPEFMSPALARFDSEKAAADLLFDGLLAAVPDPVTGVRYVPDLVTDRGSVGAGLREYRLLGNVEWGTSALGGGGLLTAADVAGTLRLMRQTPAVPGSQVADWLDDPGFDPADPNRLRVRFKLGHIDPRSLLASKVLPAGRLLEMNKPLDDPAFARQPFGSGPFRLDAAGARRSPDDKPKEVVFTASPAFGRRPGHTGQPFVREIRMVDSKKSDDLAADFRADRLHLLLDVPTKDLANFTADNNLGGRVKVVTVADPHQVQTLAINHRRPGLQSTDLRRGLMHAIDRERILADLFRIPSMPDVHKPLAGPFPPGSWAEPKPGGGSPPPLYNRDLATARFRAYLATPAATPALSLLYPDDDPQVAEACKRIKLMVESPTSADQKKITILLEPLPPRALIERVEVEGRYDLVFLPFDYPDPWYPLTLSSALDPAAVARNGRNLYGFLAAGTTAAPEETRLSQTLAECRLHRDFDGKLVALAHRAHQQFLDAVPFVPLWQLDRHLVIATSVKPGYAGQIEPGDPRLLNPTHPFPTIGQWRVE